MVCLKKSGCDELLQLALLLSLLRVDPESYLRRSAVPIVGVDVEEGSGWAHAGPRNLFDRRTYLHPKSLDSILLSYEREVFEDLNALGRYNRLNWGSNNVTAYLLNVDGNGPSDGFSSDSASGSGLAPNSERQSQSAGENYSEPSSSGLIRPNFPEATNDSSFPDTAELTQEDMDLIEVLWKQDVDLGFSLDSVDPARPQAQLATDCGKPTKEPSDDLTVLKQLAATNLEPRTKKDDDSEDEPNSSGEDTVDPWAGLAYTIDLETGECVLKDSICDDLNSTTVALANEEPSSLLDLQEFSLEEALQLVGLEENSTEVTKEEKTHSEPSAATPSSVQSGDEDLNNNSHDKDLLEAGTSDEELGELGSMIQTAPFHHPHPRSFQSRVPVVRAMSMEQRWQDLANLLSLPGEAGHGHAGYPHHPHAHHPHLGYGSSGYSETARGVLLHNATLAPPVGDLNATGPYHSHSIGSSSNLGSAVATSMNLTNSSEPMGDAGSPASYKMESPHDMMYYQNSTPEINQTTEGFLSSILNDEDLQLMDMAMNESMYTMRMLDATGSPSNASGGAAASAAASTVSAPAGGGATSAAAEERMDASSDSAVSSMGSERVPSLSDGEWMETGSDSGHTTGDHYSPADYHASKYRPYDYSYSSRQHSSPVGATETTHRMPPMAQKKHQMFGKRYFQEQGSGGTSSLGSHGTTPSLPPAPIKYEFNEALPASGNAFSSPIEPGVTAAKAPEMKYSCSVEFARHHAEPRPSLEHIQHNHSYHMPAESTGAMQRPVSRDKQKGRKSDEEHLNRDEKRARAMNIPLSVNDIINLPMDEFNERLSKYDLSEAQLSLIRDIRRRGKNKVAAQNCRKRKLDQILSLADEVKEMRDRKNRLMQERDYMLSERQRVKEKFSQLYRHIFQSLRDPDGNQYSMYEYSLQQSADGTVLLVPRGNASALLDPEVASTAAACRKREEDKE